MGQRLVAALLGFVMVGVGVYDLRTGRITAPRNEGQTSDHHRSSARWRSFERWDGKARALVLLVVGVCTLVAVVVR